VDASNVDRLAWAFAAPRGIRTPNGQIRRLETGVDLVGSRRKAPDQVRHDVGSSGPDGTSPIVRMINGMINGMIKLLDARAALLTGHKTFRLVQPAGPDLAHVRIAAAEAG
jgi:hypothetical protein